jgi:prepilin-type N-terminal cleavage/methylation domain-containing protein
MKKTFDTIRRVLNRERQSRGFTLIETLVAITVLMLAIGGPLTVANRAFGAALEARNQAIASSLAQEAVEYINNRKDNYPTSWWSGGISSMCTKDHPCAIGYSGNPAELVNMVTFSACSSANNNCRLSLGTAGYTYSAPGENTFLTPFTRIFYLSGSGDMYVATVKVSWNTGVDKEVFVQELLSNVSR